LEELVGVDGALTAMCYNSKAVVGGGTQSPLEQWQTSALPLALGGLERHLERLAVANKGKQATQGVIINNASCSPREVHTVILTIVSVNAPSSGRLGRGRKEAWFCGGGQATVADCRAFEVKVDQTRTRHFGFCLREKLLFRYRVIPI
jgi:hypothetical protein